VDHPWSDINEFVVALAADAREHFRHNTSKSETDKEQLTAESLG